MLFFRALLHRHHKLFFLVCVHTTLLSVSECGRPSSGSSGYFIVVAFPQGHMQMCKSLSALSRDGRNSRKAKSRNTNALTSHWCFCWGKPLSQGRYGAVVFVFVCLFFVYLFVHMCVCPLCSIDGVMRTMNTEKLIKTLPIIQNQLDALLDFQVRAFVRTWCVCVCFYVFMCVSGNINMLSLFFCTVRPDKRTLQKLSLLTRPVTIWYVSVIVCLYVLGWLGVFVPPGQP